LVLVNAVKEPQGIKKDDFRKIKLTSPGIHPITNDAISSLLILFQFSIVLTVKSFMIYLSLTMDHLWFT